MAASPGNPATVIKYRFSEDDIARLLALKIYDLPEEKLLAIQPILSSGNITELETILR
ncbi:hypothetical protein ACUYF8_11590 [Enterobacter asburiae]